MLENLLLKAFYGNTIFMWGYALGLILLFTIAGKIVYWIFGNVFKRLASKTETKLDDIIVDMLEEPIVFVVFIFGFWFGFNQLTFTDVITKGFWNVFQILVVINVAWLLTRLFEALFEEYIVPLASKTKTDLDDTLLPIVKKGTKAIIWSISIIVALNNAGYNVGAILAGLGIGGIAFAMAAKDSLANIFGGFTIITDRPFTIKDRIKINGHDGVVKEIGLRSTRIQTLEGRMIIIPNSKFTENAVENISIEPSRKVVLNLGLTYDTTAKQMEKAMEILKGIASKNENLKEKVMISFTEFGDFSLGILFIYYIKKGADILATKNAIDLEILNQFNKNKLEFAFPTQTIYSKK